MIGAWSESFDVKLDVLSVSVPVQANWRHDAGVRAPGVLSRFLPAWLACIIQVEITAFAVVEKEPVQVRLLLTYVLVHGVLRMSMYQIVGALGVNRLTMHRLVRLCLKIYGLNAKVSFHRLHFRHRGLFRLI